MYKEQSTKHKVRPPWTVDGSKVAEEKVRAKRSDVVIFRFIHLTGINSQKGEIWQKHQHQEQHSQG